MHGTILKFIKLSVVFVVVFLCSLPTMAQVSITESNTPVGNLSQYAYSIQNIGQTAILAFSLNVATPITVVTSPSGWVGEADPDGNTTIVNWVATDTPFEIQPGMMLPGFGFVSTSTVGNIQYSAIDENFNNIDGITRGPVVAAAASTPEPSSIIIFSSGLASLMSLILIPLTIRWRESKQSNG